MNFDVSVIDRVFRYFLIIISSSLGVAQFIFNNQNQYIDAGFIIFMAGSVGYFTNFLAIKMLFQPKQGRVLGWSGLVPRNKRKIAASLAESVQTQLLAPEIIIGYIYEHDLLEKGTEKLTDWVDTNLQDENIREMITERIVSYMKDRGPDYINNMFDASEEALKSIARNPDEIQRYWGFIRKYAVDYMRTRENRERVADQLRFFILDEIPQLSVNLNTALEEYLNRKNFAGKVGITLKKLISFNDEAIKDMLYKFVNDPDTYDNFMGMLDIMVEQFQEKLSSPETQESVMHKVEEWVTATGEYARQNILPSGIEQLEKYLDNRDNWQQIDDMLFKMINWFKTRAVEFIDSEEGREQLELTIESLIHRLNVTQLVEEQVMKLDTDELEKMILDNTGGNLVVIQVLGGTLGMVAGLIQVNVIFALPVLSLVALAFISARINRRKFS